ncbi:MBL fold metallo-hydrolase [Alloacidobacterium sp.]|uniref:MBL fold metallo-hydrolase n=1 Tax=Alloacidobacterium sp. TaxID=2951999 RepID=UPI002D666CB3|nr:MBL fold metallo-hydrolase [Alloacidobacterium sp.]HYK37814.1 MBL fold metallo-hydrolase [Alloacidobacterium sp.]
MKIKLLGSSVPDPARRQYVSSYVINGTVAIDAGCLGSYGTPQEQESIRHVFLTHSHMDHTASLPIFVENAWTPAENCPRIYGSSDTLDAVQKHIFNEVMWPDFIALSRSMPPFLHFCPLQVEVPVEADGFRIIPVPVNHVVPTFAYVVSNGVTAVIFGADSGPTMRLWEVARQTTGLRAVFLEACFPNSLTGLAEASLHLTAEMFGREVAKMPTGIKIVAVHIKVRYREQVVRELEALQLPNLEIGECEKEYDF